MNQEAINVLMLVPTLRVSNGVGSFAMTYYRQIDHKKVHMDFVLYRNIDSPYISEIRANGDKVYFLPDLKHPIRHFAECKNILGRKQYDIIHNNSLLVTLPLLFAAKKRVPVRILHSHSTKMGENKKRQFRNASLMPLLRALSNKYAACSEIAGKAMFGAKPFSIIPDVIETNLFKYNEEVREAIREREKCNDHFIIGTVGRVSDAKNPFFAIDVIEKVIAKESKIEYWWIGSGGLDLKVKQYIENKSLQEKIRLFGSREDVAELYQAMDLFFMPSKFEGFGLACVEAQTSGLNCVVSDALSKEVDITGNVSFISLDSDINTWVDAIIRTMKDGKDRSVAYSKALSSACSAEQAGKKLTLFYQALAR